MGPKSPCCYLLVWIWDPSGLRCLPRFQPTEILCQHRCNEAGTGLGADALTDPAAPSAALPIQIHPLLVILNPI